MHWKARFEPQNQHLLAHLQILSLSIFNKVTAILLEKSCTYVINKPFEQQFYLIVFLLVRIHHLCKNKNNGSVESGTSCLSERGTQHYKRGSRSHASSSYEVLKISKNLPSLRYKTSLCWLTEPKLSSYIYQSIPYKTFLIAYRERNFEFICFEYFLYMINFPRLVMCI